jgi:hypothetical protein
MNLLHKVGTAPFLIKIGLIIARVRKQEVLDNEN